MLLFGCVRATVATASFAALLATCAATGHTTRQLHHALDKSHVRRNRADWVPQTTNDVVPAAGACGVGACGQGALFMSSLLHHAGTDIDVAVMSGADLAGEGWSAGVVTTDKLAAVYTYADPLCRMRLRGSTLLKLISAMIGSRALPPSAPESTTTEVLQLGGLRVTYSTTLPPTARLLSVEVQSRVTDTFAPLDPARLYGVAALVYDVQSTDRLNSFLGAPTLDGEVGGEGSCTEPVNTAAVILAYMQSLGGPYTFPSATDMLVGVDGGVAMQVYETQTTCSERDPPHYYEPNIDACLKCPTSEPCTRPRPPKRTTNLLPAAGETGCETKLCAQGVMFAEALRSAYAGVHVGFVSSGNVGGPGWAAGNVTEDEVTLAAPNAVVPCRLTLLGSTVLRFLQFGLSSAALSPATQDGVADRRMLHFSGLRVTYAEGNAPMERLVVAEVWNGSSSSYEPVRRDTYYAVAMGRADIVLFTEAFFQPMLEGETAPLCHANNDTTILQKFLEDRNPYTIPDPGVLLKSVPSAAPPLKIFETAEMCYTADPIMNYQRPKLLCVPCTVSDAACGPIGQTTNALLPDNSLVCKVGPCGQGSLLAAAVRFATGTGIGMFWGRIVGVNGWPAGYVSPDDALKLFGYRTLLCEMKLRGATLLRLISLSTSSLLEGAVREGSSSGFLLHFHGLRVTYSTTLPPSRRLVSVEVGGEETVFVPLNRSGLYSIAMEAFAVSMYPLLDALSLDGESKTCRSSPETVHVVEQLLAAKSPFTIPNASGALVGVPTDESVTLDESEVSCMAMDPPQMYVPRLDSCMPCPRSRHCTSHIAPLAAGPSSTTNRMPSANRGECTLRPCAQGALVADALTAISRGAATIAFAAGLSLGGTGWEAGAPLTLEAAARVYDFAEPVCMMRLRGVSIRRIVAAMVASDVLATTNRSAAMRHELLQFGTGVRVSYSTTRGPLERLVAVEVRDGRTGAFVPLEAMQLYGVAAFEYDTKLAPYAEWAAAGLVGESKWCAPAELGKVVLSFLAQRSPYTIPAVDGGLVGIGAEAPEPELDTPERCAAKAGSHYFDDSLGTCVACLFGGACVGPPTRTTAAAMPSAATCGSSPCGAGALVTRALQVAGNATVALVVGRDLGGSGWSAGPVFDADLRALQPGVVVVCRLELRGVTLLRLVQASLSSWAVSGVHTGSTDAPFLQFAGLRIRYSTTLPAWARALSVEVNVAGVFEPVVPSKLYAVAASERDRGVQPFAAWIGDSLLPGETASCGGHGEFEAGALAASLFDGEGFDVGDPAWELISEGGRTALVVDTASDCAWKLPPHFYNGDSLQCEPCPSSLPYSLGTRCSDSTESPATAAPSSPAASYANPLPTTSGSASGTAGWSGEMYEPPVLTQRGSRGVGNAAVPQRGGVLTGAAVGVATGLVLLIVLSAVALVYFGRRQLTPTATDYMDEAAVDDGLDGGSAAGAHRSRAGPMKDEPSANVSVVTMGGHFSVDYGSPSQTGTAIPRPQSMQTLD